MNPYANQAMASYRQAAAAVHPTVAVVKLYDATLLAMLQAIKAREAGQYEECFIKVMRAATILRGLDHALDFDKGGAVAERLHRVYQGYILTMHLSFGKKDVIARYSKLYGSLAKLRDSWAKIAGLSDGADEVYAAPQSSASEPDDATDGDVTTLPATTETHSSGFDATAFLGLTAAVEPAGKTEAATPPRTRPSIVRGERPRVTRTQHAHEG